MSTGLRTTPLHSSQVSETAEVLARAFVDDPAWLWAIPDGESRARVLPWFFRAATRYGLAAGEVHATAGALEGAAIVLPPPRPHLDSPRLARAGLWLMPFKAGLGAFSRFLTMWRTLEDRHKRDVPPQHWYVWLLGVDPARQGRGLGSNLIQAVLARADQDGVPCYLDTTQERNLRFYGRHGFEVVYEGDFPRGGPHLWTLRRDPKR
ncbi:MAG: GNAT family N-acetyltransferase [Dehalococcoidia bacterium]|nr:GNAT family N-acetyltransferase [Dehalococcoidia bacterium]MDZ4278685.1 GNAT family N-acetyltransferase [Dehalococcoidia bacterium]